MTKHRYLFMSKLLIYIIHSIRVYVYQSCKLSYNLFLLTLHWNSILQKPFKLKENELFHCFTQYARVSIINTSHLQKLVSLQRLVLHYLINPYKGMRFTELKIDKKITVPLDLNLMMLISNAHKYILMSVNTFSSSSQ